jgi:transposase
VLDDTEKHALTVLIRKHGAPQALADRARIVLAAANGLTNKEIAAQLGICPHTAGVWRNRFVHDRMDGLYDEPRPGAPRQIGDDAIAATIRKTLEVRPEGATHWSLRTMAKEAGYAPSTIHRIWRAFGLQPHRSETSNCRPIRFSLKRCAILWGSICRRLSVPSCCASMRKAKCRRLTGRNGQIERRTHDYKRNGTTSLFAALDVQAGTVVGKCMPRHRAAEFRKFLDEVERNVPAGFAVHAIMDNYGTHKTVFRRAIRPPSAG